MRTMCTELFINGGVLEVCSQVVIELELQPVSQSDYPTSWKEPIMMNGFWGGNQKDFCICMCLLINPLATSNVSNYNHNHLKCHVKSVGGENHQYSSSIDKKKVQSSETCYQGIASPTNGHGKETLKIICI